jgi:hypothetical protein
MRNYAARIRDLSEIEGNDIQIRPDLTEAYGIF